METSAFLVFSLFCKFFFKQKIHVFACWPFSPRGPLPLCPWWLWSILSVHLVRVVSCVDCCSCGTSNTPSAVSFAEPVLMGCPARLIHTGRRAWWWWWWVGGEIQVHQNHFHQRPLSTNFIRDHHHKSKNNIVRVCVKVGVGVFLMKVDFDQNGF